MTIAELLSHLQNQHVTLRADNDHLILNGPKGALTSALRAELIERKTEILAFLRNTTRCAKPEELSPRRLSRKWRLPLSFAQQRLWFLDQYEPGSSVYNVPSAQRLRGPLDIGALEHSLGEIVGRHEALRTTFSVVEGEPVQVIAPAASISLPVSDLSHFADSEREEEAQRLATAEARRPFDLSQGPLFRATLIRLDEDDHILLCSMHHIVSDGWSIGVLYRELSVLYQAFSQGHPSPLAGLPIQYADYAVWQREWLKGDELDRQLSYWKKQLEGAPAVLNLPTDRPRPAVQSHRGARQSITLSKELSEKLKGLSRTQGVTLFMTLLAAFQTLLYRYTGQEDIVVGSPIANRTRTEIEGLIGFFVNTLVLRSNFSSNPTFKELLAQVRETALGAYAHQDLPFEKLVEELKPERTPSHSPLFQVMFVLQNAPSTELKFEGLSVSPVRVGEETAKFDLTFSVNQAAEGLRFSLHYDTDLFDASTIERMIGHFRTLLEGIVANPEQRISDLPMLTEAEKHQLLIEWNDTKADYPKDKCIHELFEEQVDRTPEAVAVVFEDQQLTYRELNTRANQLAHHLQELGVGPDLLVGICMERSLEMVVGLLGILKAGGAYVPLDPTYPKERLGFMLEDTKAGVILTDTVSLNSLPPVSARTICLDRDWEKIRTESQNNPSSQSTANNLAYVIYTSGSTGRPKGVQVAHRAVSNFLTHARKVLSPTKKDTFPLVANICFDISVMELFLPLLSGARLVVASHSVVIDGTRIQEMLSESEITIMHATPATWRMLLQTGWTGAANLTILCGGEALQIELADELMTRGSSVWNLYGPTETTIFSSFTRYRHPYNHGTVSIGRAVANTQFYILDDHLLPVPIGVSGQLHIGGDGLARGYLNRPDLTAEKYIPDPFSKTPGARLYRTGDLARYLPDGNVAFLGRIDHQVKLRGFRIELGEIEAVLGEHSKVRQSVILSREDVPGDKRLVAYVVPTHSRTAPVNELRAFLKNQLPEYMVPSAFVFMESLPLTPNGKLDRKALSAPDKSSFELATSYVAPRTREEKLIAEIWAEVLRLEKVGIHDNFFDLGGHSLKATQIISRLRASWRMDLPLRVLFEAPTVAELALRLERSASESDELEEFSRNLAEVESLTDEEIERQQIDKHKKQQRC